MCGNRFDAGKALEFCGHRGEHGGGIRVAGGAGFKDGAVVRQSRRRFR